MEKEVGAMADKPRVLLVDDEPSIVKMVGKRLETEGFQVSVAMDGQEALAKIQSEHPDLVILDLMLPKVNGYEVCTMMKQDTRHRQIPVVIFTAKTQEKDEKMAVECGADAFVRKPFRAEELMEKIRSLLAGAPRLGETPS
jgi:two-component system phosphate regulon response regulator PhoB